MNSVVLSDETRKLRTKSPTSSNKVRAVAIIAVTCGFFFSAAHLFAKRPGEPWWFSLALLVATEIVCACVGIWLYTRIRRFIENGQVIYARVTSTHWLPNGIYRINLEYEFDNKWYKKAINGPRSIANTMENQPALLVVVDPNNPKDCELLQSFATRGKEYRAILSGESGLSEDN